MSTGGHGTRYASHSVHTVRTVCVRLAQQRDTLNTRRRASVCGLVSKARVHVLFDTLQADWAFYNDSAIAAGYRGWCGIRLRCQLVVVGMARMMIFVMLLLLLLLSMSLGRDVQDVTVLEQVLQPHGTWVKCK